MLRYVIRRLLAIIPVLLGVSMVAFGILHLVPGDVAQLIAGNSGSAPTPQQIAATRHRLGLDEPLVEQYGRFLERAVLHGDLGRSFYTNQSVTSTILQQLPATLRLTGAALVVALALGFSLGVLAAIRQGTWVDTLTMSFSLGGASIPTFWSGLMLIYFFGVKLQWLPITGGHSWKPIILPAVVLGYDSSAYISRMVRSSMLEVLRNEFVRTARSKGLSERVIIWRHVLKAAMIPVVTFVGLQCGRLLGGAVVVETVFARQGIGRITVEAILQKDYYLVVGVVLFFALIYVLINVVVDISYTWLDPRVRYQG